MKLFLVEEYYLKNPSLKEKEIPLFFQDVNKLNNEVYLVGTKEEMEALQGLSFIYGKDILISVSDDLDYLLELDPHYVYIVVKLILD